MKRFLAFFLALILALSVAGCGREVIDEPSETFTPAEHADWGVTLSAENVTPSGMTLILSQSGGNPTGELQFGSSYAVYVRKNGAWEKVPYIIDGENLVWTMEAYLLPMGGSAEQELGWEGLYGALPSGSYLLTKTVSDFRGPGDFDDADFSVEFEIP